MIACGARAPGDLEGATQERLVIEAEGDRGLLRVRSQTPSPTDPNAVAFHADRALRLSPFDPRAVAAHFALGIAAVSEGRYEDAVGCFARAF
jgi:hypothetical protein